jgi:hypothetical protein
MSDLIAQIGRDMGHCSSLGRGILRGGRGDSIPLDLMAFPSGLPVRSKDAR